MNKQNSIRIEKYLAEQGLASRREAKELIAKGQVRLNGKIVTTPGKRINPDTDTISLSDQAKKTQYKRETVMVYKPRGVVSSKDTGVKTIFDTFPQFRHLNTVGRLDKDSEGLILLSNDGLVTKAITDNSHPSEKEYVVTVREDVLPWMIEKFEHGVRLEGGYVTLPAQAEKIDKHTFRITLREGKKHQIRRMANAVALTITKLQRVRINGLVIGKLRPGQSRKLSSQQVAKLKQLVVD